jgi:hypothetical protein
MLQTTKQQKLSFEEVNARLTHLTIYIQIQEKLDQERWRFWNNVRLKVAQIHLRAPGTAYRNKTTKEGKSEASTNWQLGSRKNGGYPLVNIQKTMENHHF